jgi:hypothetical protein
MESNTNSALHVRDCEHWKRISANNTSSNEHDLRHSTDTMNDGALWLVIRVRWLTMEQNPGSMRCIRSGIARFSITVYWQANVECMLAYKLVMTSSYVDELTSPANNKIVLPAYRYITLIRL